MVKAKLNHRFPIILPKHRADRPEWYTEQGWEKKRMESMNEHLDKGDVIYYVGAELGEMPALCQMWGAEVVLFEPNHSAWPSIRAIWEANKLSLPLYMFAGFASTKTQLEPPAPDMALYEGKGYTIANDRWPIYSQGEIIEAHGFSELDKEADGLPQIAIDDLVFGANLKPPTAITLDVEGAEYAVLKGAEQTLKQYHPKIWLSLHPEFLFDKYNMYAGDLRKWIKDLGYKETLLDYQHEVHLFYEPI